MKNCKKGFTLIELIAMIIILGILTVVSMPVVNDIIYNMEKESYTATCKTVYKAMQNYKLKNIKDKKCVVFDFESDRVEEEIIEGIKYVPKERLELEGLLPESGTGKICDNKIEIAADNGEFTCIVDKQNTILLEGNIDEVDTTKPIINSVMTSTSLTSIRVIVDAKDEDGEIVKYYYKLDDKEVESTSEIQDFTNLNPKQIYTLEVEVENKSGLKSDKVTKELKLVELTNPKFELALEDKLAEYTWATSKTIKILYSNEYISNPEYYFKSDVESIVDKNVVTHLCGTGNDPNNCEETIVSTLQPNIWYKVKSAEPQIKFNNNGTLTALIKAENNLSAQSTYEVTQVSNNNPTKPLLVGGNDSWINESQTISISEKSSEISGIKKYQYYVSTSNSDQINGKWDDVSNDLSISISENGERYIYVRAIANNGKESISDYVMTKIDTKKPTIEASVNGPIITFTIKDNVGNVSYGVNTSTETEPSYTLTTGTEVTKDYLATELTSYVIWAKDQAGNITKTTKSVTKLGWEFAYNGEDGSDGSIQTFTIPTSGTYKLEVWGAQGGTIHKYPSSYQEGGLGGYSYGNKFLEKDTIIYIVVGGRGLKSDTEDVSNNRDKDFTVLGGYNGGGNGVLRYASSGSYNWHASGGGATHIAISTGLLSSLASKTSSVLIVAGGGGGSKGSFDHGGESGNRTKYYKGGTGGGITGGPVHRKDGTPNTDSYYASSIGTQTNGGTDSNNSSGGFGFGGSGSGGGSGWYGGTVNAGGSGYIGGVENGNTISGDNSMPTHDGTSTMIGNSGHGYAKISVVSLDN